MMISSPTASVGKIAFVAASTSGMEARQQIVEMCSPDAPCVLHQQRRTGTSHLLARLQYQNVGGDEELSMISTLPKAIQKSLQGLVLKGISSIEEEFSFSAPIISKTTPPRSLASTLVSKQKIY